MIKYPTEIKCFVCKVHGDIGKDVTEIRVKEYRDEYSGYDFCNHCLVDFLFKNIPPITIVFEDDGTDGNK